MPSALAPDGIPWLVAAGVSIAMLVVSALVSAWVLVRLPADYFVAPEPPLPFADRALPVRYAGRFAKNLLGALLVVLGALLSLPGVPGQGLLTILLGLMLLDVPGRRRLEQRLLRRPFVHRPVNRLRARWGRPPLVLPAG